MSDLNSTNWSQTAASNNATPPNGWPEGMNPAQVNDTAREMMAALKKWYVHINPTVTSGGSANVQTLTYSVAPAALVAGDRYCFLAGFTNSGAATLNVNALGATTVHTVGGNALTGGEITAGFAIEVFYDGTYFRIISASGLTNPTTQTFLSGSGTYNTPAGVKWIEIELVGGGGGGGAQAGSAGSAGGNTTFGTLTGSGGGGGAGSGGSVGTGGAASGGSKNIAGASGNGGSASVSGSISGAGGPGGNSALGGGGSGLYGGIGGTATANTGAGGAGGAPSAGSATLGGSNGGGAGGFVYAVIAAPSATYSYAVGAAGAASAGGSGFFGAGGGATGGIWVVEHYA